MPMSTFDQLTALQRNPKNYVRSVTMFEDCYIAFLYSDKQLKDIEQFCCRTTDNSVFGVDTTFDLADEMWLTDSSLRNERILSVRSNDHPINFGPGMLHFSKNESIFRQFCAKLPSANPALENLKKLTDPVHPDNTEINTRNVGKIL